MRRQSNLVNGDTSTLQYHRFQEFPGAGKLLSITSLMLWQHTLWEASHEGGMASWFGEAIHHMVNFGCGHAFANVLGEIIQQGRVDFGACADTGQLPSVRSALRIGSLYPSFL